MRGAQIRPSHVFTFFTHACAFKGLEVPRTRLASRSSTSGLRYPPQVLFIVLMPLSGRLPPSTPKVTPLASGALADATKPSGSFDTPLRSLADRLRDISGTGNDLRVPFPKVQSPTVAPRGRGPKPTVRTHVNCRDCACPSGSSRRKMSPEPSAATGGFECVRVRLRLRHRYTRLLDFTIGTAAFPVPI